jgi:hypothetical protein
VVRDAKTFKRRLALGLASFLAVLSFQNCDQTRLLLVNELASAKSDGEICAIEPSEQSVLTKVMFVVDKSGSNGTTDPGATYRAGTIGAFYNLHAANQYTKWGLITFQDGGANPVILDATGTVGGFTNDMATITAAIGSLAAGNNGATPYQAAIAATSAAITRDVAANPNERSMYVVVFISDGAPQPAVTDTVLETDIRALLALGDVTFNSVYYGPANQETSSRMLRMANWGRGKFLDTNISGRIPLDSLIGFKSGQPWLIKNLTVTNLNASPCDDGSIDADSDADGLCDKDEIRYNTEFLADKDKVYRMEGKTFDPANRNSFDPYLSDAIFYKYIVFSEGVPRDCTAADLVDEDRDLANRCEERYLYSSSPSGPTEKWTSAMQRDGDPLNYDSDGDGYLDFFEFMMTRNRSAAMDRNNVSQLFLGFRLDTIFNKHLNWRNPVASAAYDGVFQFKRVNERGQNCYSYNQTVLPVYVTRSVSVSQVSGNANLVHGQNENVVMISFVQTPELDPNGAGDLRYTFQRVSASANHINLNLRIEEYQSFRVPSAARVNQAVGP